MKKSYRLEDLDCANCAAKLEKKLSDIENMDKVSVNFMTLKCVIEAADENMDKVIEKAMAVIKKETPDVTIKRA